MKANSSWLKRTLAMLLVVVTLVGLIPTSVIASAAESLRSNSYIPGDVNEDGELNALDVNLLRRYIVGGYDVTIHLLAADVNTDGEIDAQDVNNIRRYIAGGYDIELKPGYVPSYSVKFYDGERLIDTLTVEKDQPLGAVPSVEKSSKANAILLGYYTDPGFTQPFYAENPVTGDMNVYAKYEEMGSAEELNFTSFAQMDQTPDLSFQVVGTGDPVQAITLEVKDGSDAVELKFEATDDGYIVSAANGFNEGSSYQLHLADGWTFKDKPETITTATFSIAKEQVENMQMNEDIIYILDTDAIDYLVGGKTYDMINSDLITEQGGSFVYTNAAAIKPDDLICIYVGTHPEERGFDGDMLDPAYYVKATEINGTTVKFTALDEDDTLRLYNIPDNFPFKAEVLPTATTGTINMSKLDLEMYVTMYGDGYDLETAKNAIAVGDFISIYNSNEIPEDEGSVYFGEITAYNEATGEITYKKTTRDAILESMDLYRDIEIGGEDLITDEEAVEIQNVLLNQIRDSGFAEDAAFMLADMVSKTDGFKNKSIEHLMITDSQGNQLSAEEIQLLNLGKSFELTDDIKLTVELIREGEQLHYKKGTQIAVGVEAEFEVELEDDEKIKIQLNATFVQEIELSPQIKGYVIPYFVGIIPLPVGGKVNGTVDIKSFTAFSFEATIYTVAPEDESLWDQFKDTVQNPEKLADIAGLPEGLASGLKTAGDVLDKIRELKDDLSKMKDTAEGALDTAEAYAKDIALLWDTIDHVITEQEYSAICEALDQTSVTSDLLDMLELTDETGLNTEYYESMEALMERYCEMIEQETDWVTLLDKDIFDQDVCVYGVAIGVDIDFVVRADLSLAIGSNMQYEVGKRYEFWFKFAPLYKKAGCETMDLLDEKFAFQFYVMGRLGLKAGIRGKLECGIGTCKAANVGVALELGPYMKLWGFFVYEYEKYRAADTNKWHSDERMAGALLMEFGLYFKLAFEAEALAGLYEYECEFLDKEIPLLTIGDEHYYYEMNYAPEEDEVLPVRDADNNSKNGITMLLPTYTLELNYLDMREGYLAIEPLEYDRYIYTVSNPNFSIDPKTGEISVNVPEGTRYMECDLTITYKYGKLAFSTYDMSITVPLIWSNMSDSELSEYYTASVRVGNDADGYTTVWTKRVLKNREFDLPTVEEIQELIGWNEYKYDMGTGYGDQQIEGLTLTDDKVYDFNIGYDTYSITVEGVEKADGTTESRTFYAKYGETFNFSSLVSTGADADGKYHKFSQLSHNVNGLYLNKAIDTRMASILEKGVTVKANYVDNSITATFTFVGLKTENVTVTLRRGSVPDLTLVQSIAEEAGMAIKNIAPAVATIRTSTTYKVTCGVLDTEPATITFVENGGSNVEDITKPYGSLIGTLPTPSKTGHTFAGWYTNEGLTQRFTGTKVPKGGLTLYAKWTVNKYTVTLHVNGGNEIEENTRNVVYGNAYGELPKPVRTGYGFIGWFTAAEGGEQITAESVYAVAGNQTLYARWRKLIELPADTVEFSHRDVNYDPGKSYDASNFGKMLTYPSGVEDGALDLNDFTYEFICEGYESEGYSAVITTAGNWGVKVTRPADDTFAKFEAFLPNVMTVNKGTRELTGLEVGLYGYGYYYIDVKVTNKPSDVDSNATYQYTFGTLSSKNVFTPIATSKARDYWIIERVMNLTPGTTYKAMQVTVANDRNYEDASIILDNVNFSTLSAPTNSWNDYANTSWYYEQGVAYCISTPSALAGLAKLVNEGVDFSGKIVWLSGDLDLRGHTWVPIGTSKKPFKGTFEGYGHTITGLYLDDSSKTGVGLFGYVTGSSDSLAVVRNVAVDDSWFYGKDRVGAVVGQAKYALVDNCVNYTNVKAHQLGLTSSYQSCAGGIVGEALYSKIVNCVNYGSVYAQGRLVGGVVGLVDKNGIVINNANFGSVTGASRVGGVIGCMDGGNTLCWNNYNAGTVRPRDGSNDYIGGVVGRNVDDKGVAQFMYYLKDSAKGGNGKGRYAMGNDGGSVADGNKDYDASSFETLDSILLSSAAIYGAGKTLIDALNACVEGESEPWDYYAITPALWEATGPNGYPLPVGSPISKLR